jgi:YidC/Oxa1 family membrane protein insertase
MWDLIINPFITVLTLLYDIFGNNIVLAIAVLTVMIRLATSPLMISQQKSAKAMQELQPELKKLQEKYKNDREKLAQAQMQMYKEYGINPLGGCLPLFIQLPILLALYQAIIHGLAGTPYQLIDLSGRLLLPGLDHLVPMNNMWVGMDLTLAPTDNPTYALLLPLMVMATTWLQSRLTIPTPPSDGDGGANQAAQMTRTMTTIMPLMFGFFSLSFSVGLSIYFVVSNLVGIVQYTLMGRAEWGRLIGRVPEEEKKQQQKQEQPKIVEGKAAPIPAGAKAKTNRKAAPTNGKTPGAPAQPAQRATSKKNQKMKKRT